MGQPDSLSYLLTEKLDIEGSGEGRGWPTISGLQLSAISESFSAHSNKSNTGSQFSAYVDMNEESPIPQVLVFVY